MLSVCLIAPHGTGMAGLHGYSGPEETKLRFGHNFTRLSEIPESAE
jgi:hypothetical protein